MNDQLQSVLLSILQSTVDTAGQIKDLVIEETPLVVQQLLIWKGAESLISFLICVAMLISWVVWFFPKYKAGCIADTKLPNYEMPAWIIFGTIGSICWLPLAVLKYYDLDWLQILIAPKVYLIEYMAELGKGM